MGELATQSHLTVWHAMLNAVSIRQRWGQELQAKGLKRLEQRVADAHAKDNVRALERLTRHRGRRAHTDVVKSSRGAKRSSARVRPMWASSPASLASWQWSVHSLPVR